MSSGLFGAIERATRDVAPMDAFDDDVVAAVDAQFRAANYLSVAQLYLRDNVLLREPLRREHIKRRLLGHWGTVPGITFTYAHLGLLARDFDESIALVVGPGHGAPGVLANLWLEDALVAHLPTYTRDLRGMTQLARDFSWPRRLPSHLTASTPGAMHEGGELGYSLAHAFGMAFDDPDTIVACLIGDGEAETGPLAAAWQSTAFLNPARDGAVLPILHLNGYKLSGPTVLARRSPVELRALLLAHGFEAYFVDAAASTEPDRASAHREMAAALRWARERIRSIQLDARTGTRSERVSERVNAPRTWPAIVLRTPKGWTCPAELDGAPLEGTVRTHQIPIGDPVGTPAHLAALEFWMRSYRPEELFDRRGEPQPRTLAALPRAARRIGNHPLGNAGARLRPLALPPRLAHAVDVPARGAVSVGATSVLGEYLRDVMTANAAASDFRLFSPDETKSNRLNAVFDVSARTFELPLQATDEGCAPDGRIMEVLSEHCCEGWLEGYLLAGRHGLFACYEAFLSIIDSMMLQHAKWLKVAGETGWRAPIASLNYLVTSHVWEQDHNGYSHQGPGFINLMLTRKPSIARVYLPPDANTLVAVAEHCLASRNYVNLIVASKSPMPQWLTASEAAVHCEAGMGSWEWAGSDAANAQVVLAAAGDVPTRETLAAAWWLRRLVPSLRFRVVNVVHLFALQSPDDHPHGAPHARFHALFGSDTEVVFAFHGYPSAIHELVHHRPNPTRFHVRGYVEEGTTTTPFDMTACNGMSRYHIAIEALRRVGLEHETAPFIRMLEEDQAYIAVHGVDAPRVSGWHWSNHSEDPSC